MLTRLDHVIIAVRDLDGAAIRFSSAMGLVMQPGGDHPGWGTHNAIGQFGLDYLELVAVRDREEAKGNSRGRALLSFLERGEGLMGFALGSDNLSRDVEEMRLRGVDVLAPFSASRLRKDGTLMEWSMSHAPGDPWGETLPILIQHRTPDEQRLGWRPSEGHVLSARAIAGVSLAVADLDAARTRYERFFGRAADLVEEVPALPARRAVFLVDGLRLELLTPLANSGGLFEFVRERGEGLFMVSLAVPEIDLAVDVLRDRGTAIGSPTRRRRSPLLDPSQTLGARFQLIEQAP